MADYKAGTVAGNTWQRCKNIAIQNPSGGVPTVAFEEEEVMVLGDKEIKAPTGGILKVFDPAIEFQMYDPTTGEPIEGQTMNYGQVYAVLYSAYRSAAVDRDAEAAPPAP